MTTLIKNVRLVDSHLDCMGAVLIEDGKIQHVLKEGNLSEMVEAEEKCAKSIDGLGLCLMPAFTDMHFHMRYPGGEGKETMETGEAAAVKGGYTALCTMANTSPVCDNPQVFEKIMKRHEEVGLCDIFQISAVTKGLEGKETVDFGTMKKLTSLFSDDGKTLVDSELAKEAFKKSRELDFIVMAHCEPESKTVRRHLGTMAEVPGRLHICHISKRKTVDLIRAGKAAFGDLLTCEVTPHHLFAEDLDYRVNPSFGTSADRESLLDGARSGLIDVIGTDHAPHSRQDKLNGSPGISNVEIAFEMVHTVFERENIGIGRLVEMMAEKPAELLGLSKGRLLEGMDADLVLADLDVVKKISSETFSSKGRNTPFDGWETKGEIVLTMKEGRVIYDSRQIAR
ncbi:MAG: dihydroorotase [Clostridiales bacterium]|nr:MAG: dihydroorotase [Clostridiales bacterium]